MAHSPDVDNPTWGYYVTSSFEEVVLYVENILSRYNCSVIFSLHASALFEKDNERVELHMPTFDPVIVDPQMTTQILYEILENLHGLCYEPELFDSMEGSGFTLVPGTHRFWFKVFPCQPNESASQNSHNVSEYGDEDDDNPGLREDPIVNHLFLAIIEYYARKEGYRVPYRTAFKKAWLKEYCVDNPGIGILPDDLEVEMKLQDLPDWHFDVQRHNIRVFSMRGNLLYSKKFEEHDNYMNLYLNSKNQFALIINLNTLYNRKAGYYFCEKCLYFVGPKHTCEQQVLVSFEEDVQIPSIPEGRHALVCYADFESIIDAAKQHITSGWGYVAVDKFHSLIRQDHKNALDSDTLIKDFIEALIETANDFAHSDGRDSENCKLCDQPILENEYVTGRNFINGKSGSHHVSCWENKLNCMYVFMHNFRGYDSHFIMEELVSHCNILGLQGNSMEKFNLIRFKSDNDTMIQIAFKDTYNFFSASLAKCVSMVENWIYTPETSRSAKGVFPYEWFDSFEKLKATSLPPPPWKNSLSNSYLDHETAFKEWEENGFREFSQYHDFYMMNDVTQLCDVFEEFRRTCVDQFNTDPVHFQGAPSLTWYLGLCQNPSLFKIIKDKEVYMDIQRNIRGGISQAMKRYCNVEDKEDESMFFLDVNSLYSKCMTYKMPTNYLGKFDTLPENWEELYNPNTDKTALICVDLVYPEHLHDRDWAYPLAPHKFNDRLCTTFKRRENYLIHAELLSFYLERGLVLEKVHYYYEFNQDYTLRDYVQGNIEKRRHTKSEVMKTLYKLLNNSLYGKTCENVFKYRTFKTIPFESYAEMFEENYTGQINKDLIKTKNMQLFGDNYLVELRTPQVRLNKPIQIGFTILEFAKREIYKFLAIIQDEFGNDVIPLYTDTDSLLFWCNFAEPWKYFYNSPLRPYLDFEKVPEHWGIKTHDTHKQSGLWAPEAGGKEIVEYVGLRAKSYCYRFRDETVVIKNKGIPQSAMVTTDIEDRLESNITMEHYKQALFMGIEHRVSQFNIRSNQHQVITKQIYKLGISGNDLKRAVLPNRVDSLPFGYAGTLFSHTTNDDDL